MVTASRPPGFKLTAPLGHAMWWVALPILLILAPIVLYLIYVLRFGVNVPWWDEWNFIPILHAMLTGHLTWAALWSQHNQDRILFPNIVELILALVTRYNVEDELLASSALLILTFCGIAGLYLRHRLGSLWGLIPVAALLFSLVQNYNSLSGFALLWFLGLFGLAVALISLDRLAVRWWVLPIAVLGATLASYSSLQGLLVWPAMLPYFLRVGSTWTQRGLWAGLAVIAWMFYFAGLNLLPSGIGGSNIFFALQHPLSAFHYLVVLVGSVIPVPFGESTSMFGAIILALTAAAFGWCCTADRLRRDPALSFPLALLLYGFLFDVVTTVGRSSFGAIEATSPRYTTDTLILLIGLYLILLRWRQQKAPTPGAGWGGLLLGALGVVLVFQVVVSVRAGWQDGINSGSNRLLAADLVVNLDRAPVSLVEDFVYPYPGPYLPAQVRVLERYHLSVFGTPAARAYARLGVVPGGKLLPDLPASPAVEADLRTSKAESRAWAVLSTLYRSRLDLQSAFARGSANFTFRLLTWATTSGVGPDADSVFLLPYRVQLDRLLKVATPNDS
ncbi:MAG TPA: hypothetical protein VNH82_09230 [Candidatus Dormibacteraeota bacterium]|nr:hypothetical protein [Candidatus Dormibacteraeota bacterium]